MRHVKVWEKRVTQSPARGSQPTKRGDRGNLRLSRVAHNKKFDVKEHRPRDSQ